MPIISPTAISPHRIGGKSWLRYWATLISATVENAAPTHVVLTFAAANTSVTSADFAVTGFTVASGSWTGAVFTLVLSSAVLIFDEDLTITFKSTNTGTVTNNVADDGNTVAWYDSADLTTITKDGGDLVSLWKDKLLSGHDLAQAAGTNQPKWMLNDGVLFDGVDNWMMTAAFTLDQPVFLYMIVNPVSWTNADQILDGRTDQSGVVLKVGSTPEIRMSAGSTAYLQSTALTLNTFHVFKGLFHGASSRLTIDTTASTDVDLATTAWGGFTLAARGGGAGRWSHIKVKEIILRKSADDSTLETLIDTHLKKKL